MTPAHFIVAQDDLVPTCMPYRIVSQLLRSRAHSSATRKQRLTKPDVMLDLEQSTLAARSGPLLTQGAVELGPTVCTIMYDSPPPIVTFPTCALAVGSAS
jgi:hypothetical protein